MFFVALKVWLVVSKRRVAPSDMNTSRHVMPMLAEKRVMLLGLLVAVKGGTSRLVFLATAFSSVVSHIRSLVSLRARPHHSCLVIVCASCLQPKRVQLMPVCLCCLPSTAEMGGESLASVLVCWICVDLST